MDDFPAIADLLNVDDFEKAARRRLPRMYFEYIAGGAEDEVTLRDNRAAFDRWRFVPRVLRGVREVSLATTLLGREHSWPVLIAPMGVQRIVCDEGEIAMARGARRQSTAFTLSTVATCSIEDVAEQAGPWGFQLYLLRDRSHTLDLVRRAEERGAASLIVTVDTPVMGNRECNVRNRFVLPQGVGMANFDAPAIQSLVDATDGQGLVDLAQVNFEPAIGWSDIEWIASNTRLPIVVKGILAPEDARIAVDRGAKAIVVSNHGGRQLDGAVATLDALPGIVDAVAGGCEVYLDGGIRRGADIVKALALGARAVFVGRPVLWGLAAGGEEGVVRMLEILREELTVCLHLCGVASPAGIDRSLVCQADRVSCSNSQRYQRQY